MKNTLYKVFLFAIILFAIIYRNQNNKSDYNCKSGDCENGYGYYVTGTTKYRGDFKDGKFHGTGWLNSSYKNVEEKYLGDFINGRKNGQGTHMWFVEGVIRKVYDGGFQNDKQHGEGIIKHYSKPMFSDTEDFCFKKLNGNFINGNANGKFIKTEYSSKHATFLLLKSAEEAGIKTNINDLDSNNMIEDSTVTIIEF